MAYYVATDKFGNYDLCHYGVKGMKWGEVNEDPLVGGIRSAANIVKTATNNVQKAFVGNNSSYARAADKAQTDGMKRTAALKAQQNQANKAVNQQASKNAKMDPQVQKQYAESVAAQTIEKAKENSDVSDDDAKKLAEANAKYQTALTNMQMLARIAQSNGVSLGQDPEYLAARKEAIKAKYELDTLTVEQQEKAAKQSEPTYAEQKQQADSDAKEKLSEDKKKSESSSSSLDEIMARQKEVLGGYGIRAADRKGGKTK